MIILNFWNETTELLWKSFVSDLKSERTKKRYRYAVNLCMDFCQKTFVMIDDEDALSFYNELKNARKEITDAVTKEKKYVTKYRMLTIYTYFTILKRFSSYIITSDVYPDYDVNPFLPSFLLCQQNTNIHTCDTIPFHDMESILKAAQSDLRDYAIISLIYRTGIKPDLICDIMVGDFVNDQNHTYLRIMKQKKEQILQLTDDLIDILDAYIKTYHIDLEKKSNYFFFNKYNNKLTQRTLEYIMSNVCTAAGLQTRYTPHQLRNSAGSLMFEFGAPETEVAKQLHISLRHINRYNTKILNPVIVSNTSNLVKIHLELPDSYST